jgi:putative ABC transport system permease protein
VTGVQAYGGQPLPERDRLPLTLATKITAVPGAGRTAADISFPVTVLRGGYPLALPPIEGHGWSSAQLTPYRLIAGQKPSGPGEAVLGRPLATRLNAKTGSTLNALARGMTLALRVTGIAAPGAGQAPAMFVTDARGRALLGRPGQADTIAVYPGARQRQRRWHNGSSLHSRAAARWFSPEPPAAGRSSPARPARARTWCRSPPPRAG